MNQYTREQQLHLQREIARIAAAVTPVVAEEDPHVVVMALIGVAASAAQHTNYTREMVFDILQQSYDQTKATMAALGFQPGQPPPADLQEKLMALIQAHPDKPPEELFQQLLAQYQQQPPQP